MLPIGRTSCRLSRCVLAGTLAMITAPALAQTAPQLVRVVGARHDITIGLTAAELGALGSTPGVERLGRKLVADGQVTAWQYIVGRGSDDATCYVTTRRIAILRNDTMRLEPYAPILPVSAPPTH